MTPWLKLGGSRVNMGQLTSADCKCGYSSDAVLGRAMKQRPSEATFPHYCPKCGVVNAPVTSDGLGCTECHSAKLTRYGTKSARNKPEHSTLATEPPSSTSKTWNANVTMPRGNSRFKWWDLELTPGDHLCPSCGEMSLRFGDRMMIQFD